MQKEPVKVRPRIRHRRGAIATRPLRQGGVRSSSVRVVVDRFADRTRLLNSYMAVAHLAIGIGLMAYSVDDILNGGPARPAIVPLLGAYLATAVVFYATLATRRPTVLAWILALSDTVVITAAHRLAFLDLVGGPDATVALVAVVMSVIYAMHAMPRLSAVTGSILLVACAWSIIEPGGIGNFALSLSKVTAVLVIGAAVATGVVLANRQRRASIGRRIAVLEKINHAAAEANLRSRRLPGDPVN